jgi:hypothetical protein
MLPFLELEEEDPMLSSVPWRANRCHTGNGRRGSRRMKMNRASEYILRPPTSHTRAREDKFQYKGAIKSESLMPRGG